MLRPVYLNAHERALRRAARLDRDDVYRQMLIVTTAIDALMRGGDDAQAAWENVAWSANMAETLASMRIGSGEHAAAIIRDAGEALAYMAQEHAQRGTWALRAEDRVEVRQRLKWLKDLHRTQLEVCSYGELERALLTTEERMKQARAGNAGRDVVVVEGLTCKP